MARRWPTIYAVNLFGDDTWLERPDTRPDLRCMDTLADELERERRIVEAIQADPWKHLRAGYTIPTLAGIVGKQNRTCVFARHWVNVPKRSSESVSNRRARRLANARRILGEA